MNKRSIATLCGVLLFAVGCAHAERKESKGSTTSHLEGDDGVDDFRGDDRSSEGGESTDPAVDDYSSLNGEPTDPAVDDYSSLNGEPESGGESEPALNDPEAEGVN